MFLLKTIKSRILLLQSISYLLWGPVFAQDSKWVRDDLLINPSGVQSFGSARIDLGDIDGDSWLDLVVLDSVGLRFYRNRGLNSSIGFERRAEWEIVPTPVDQENVGVTLSDLNDDGRADLILGNDPGNSFRYWQNTGLPGSSLWVRADSVLKGVIGNKFIALGDLDDDDDLDAVVNLDSKLRIYWNVGNSVSPEWQLDPESFVLGVLNGQPNNVRFADINEDHRIDILAGFDWAFKDALVNVGRNKSSADSLTFIFPSSATPMPDAKGLTLAVGDVDKDGKIDLLTGHDAPFLYLWNSDFDTLNSSFYQIGNLGFPFGYLESGLSIDLKQDGSGEIILVHPDPPTDILTGFLKFTRFSRRNSLWLRDPNFVFFLEDYFLNNPTLDRFDWDENGKLDMALGADKRRPPGSPPTETVLTYFTSYAPQPGFFSQFSPDSLFQDPSLVEINGDGMLDLFMQKSGRYRFYENIGTLLSPNWEARPGWSANLTATEHYRAELGDLTNNGLLDIVFGESAGSLSFFRNIGTTFSPQWERADGVLEQVRVDSFATPTLVDLDHDADLDLILGDRLGRFYAFRNDFVTSVSDRSVEITTSNTPQLLQNYPNPFNAGTTLTFTVPVLQEVSIKVYDLIGRVVEILLNEELSAGSHTLSWTPQNLPSGVYFIQIKMHGFVDTRKAVLQK